MFRSRLAILCADEELCIPLWVALRKKKQRIVVGIICTVNPVEKRQDVEWCVSCSLERPNRRVRSRD